MKPKTCTAFVVYAVLLVPAFRLCTYYSGPAALGTVMAMGLVPFAVMVTWFARPRIRAVVTGASLVVTTAFIVATYLDVFHLEDSFIAS